MSNQEYCQKLFNDYFELSRDFINMDRELSSTRGGSNLSDVPTYAALKKKWQTAISKYWDFLSLMKRQVINPNDEAQLT